MLKGSGYVFETWIEESAIPGVGYPRFVISAAGSFTREDVEWIREALDNWLRANHDP